MVKDTEGTDTATGTTRQAQVTTGAARKARDRRKRAEAGHVSWLTSHFQRLASHHTASDGMSVLVEMRAEIQEIKRRLVKLAVHKVEEPGPTAVAQQEAAAKPELDKQEDTCLGKDTEAGELGTQSEDAAMLGSTGPIILGDAAEEKQEMRLRQQHEPEIDGLVGIEKLGLEQEPEEKAHEAEEKNAVTDQQDAEPTTGLEAPGPFMRQQPQPALLEAARGQDGDGNGADDDEEENEESEEEDTEAHEGSEEAETETAQQQDVGHRHGWWERGLWQANTWTDTGWCYADRGRRYRRICSQCGKGHSPNDIYCGSSRTRLPQT